MLTLTDDFSNLEVESRVHMNSPITRIIIIKYAAYQQVHRLIEDTYVRLMNCRFHLFRSVDSSFSSEYVLFLNSSRNCFFFFLLILFPSTVLQWHHEGGNFFSQYDQSNWIFYVGYYLRCTKALNRSRKLDSSRLANAFHHRHNIFI